MMSRKTKITAAKEEAKPALVSVPVLYAGLVRIAASEHLFAPTGRPHTSQSIALGKEPRTIFVP